MDKIANENLFLLEFLVNRLYIRPDSIPQEALDNSSGENVISFRFLENEPIEICEEDFESRTDYGHAAAVTKNGKSCLFALTPSQVVKLSTHFNVDVTVFKKMDSSCLPDKLKVGTITIPIVSTFNEVIQLLVNCTEAGTVCRTLKDTFKVENEGDIIGEIDVFIRMSCFGRLIVTQFQMNLDEKSVFFKDNKGKSLYKYSKANKVIQENMNRQPEQMQEERKIECGELINKKLPEAQHEFIGRSNMCLTPLEVSPEMKFTETNACEASPIVQQNYQDMQQYQNDESPEILDRDSYQEIGCTMWNNSLTLRLHKDREIIMNGAPVSQNPFNQSGMPAIPQTNRLGSEDARLGTMAPPSSPMGPCSCGRERNKQAMNFNNTRNLERPLSIYTGNPEPPVNNVTILPTKRFNGRKRKGYKYPILKGNEMLNSDKDVFLLRLGKRTGGTADKSRVELELLTPKPPEKTKTTMQESETQYAEEDIKHAESNGAKPGGEKKGKGAKDGKGAKGAKGGKGKKGKK